MTQQINLKMPDNLVKAAQKYVNLFGFRNIQELALESIREKVFENSYYDEEFTEEEIRLIDRFIEKTLATKAVGTEEELRSVLQ